MLSLKSQILYTGDNMELNIAYKWWFNNKKCSDLKEAQGCTLPMLTIPTSLSSRIISHVVVDFSVQGETEEGKQVPQILHLH